MIICACDGVLINKLQNARCNEEDKWWMKSS